MRIANMNVQGDGPYQKLAKTPLSQDYTICGRQPRSIGLVLGIISLLVDPIPCIAIAIFLLSTEVPLDMSDDPFFREHRRSANQIPRYICAGLGILFSVIHLIGIIVLLVGAAMNNVRYFICWFGTMMCHMFMGKFAFAIFLFALGQVIAFLVAIFFIVDIFLIIGITYCFGQMALVERNKRYLSVGAVKYNVMPQPLESGQQLLPPGTYPRNDP